MENYQKAISNAFTDYRKEFLPTLEENESIFSNLVLEDLLHNLKIAYTDIPRNTIKIRLQGLIARLEVAKSHLGREDTEKAKRSLEELRVEDYIETISLLID